jgi:hypothetical protein
LFSILLLAVGFGLIGCEGPAGPPGEDGESGAANCFTCHTDDPVMDIYNIRAKAAQWEHSQHAKGETVGRNYSSCKGCHTGQGFVEGLVGADTLDVPEPNVIGCFACHAPHTNSGTADPFVTRTTAPVDLMVPSTGATFDFGEGNLCANCHQARTRSPDIHTIPPDTSVLVTSSHWGPHHGPQSNMLMGVGGYDFGLGTISSSWHTSGVTNGCPTCHMTTPHGVDAGGHSFNMEYESNGSDEHYTASCNVSGCHSGLDDFDRVTGDHPNGVQTELEALIDSLGLMLAARGRVDTAGGGYHAFDDTTYKASELGALQNLLLVEEDYSEGIHNTDYAFGLLERSLAVLDTLTLAPPRENEIANKK